MDVKADIDSVACGTASTAMVQRRVNVEEIPLLRRNFIVSFSLGVRRDSRRCPLFSVGESYCFMKITAVVWI